MKIVIISDTHNDHEALGTLSGDVLIHCGDFAFGGRADHEGIRRVDAWFARQQFQLILCTGGNHDFALAELSARRQPTFAHATYLENQAVTFQGVRFYGTPWLPELRGWAFYQPDAALAEQWAKIPEDTDVLITHTPPYGILDANSAGWQCGCRALRRRVDALRLRAHCFGHIHASAGVAQRGGTTYVNATMVDRANTIARPPFELTL